MKSVDHVRTARLLLRGWSDADLEPLSAMNADPRVMEHMPALLSRAQSDGVADAIREHWLDHGFGMWAIEIPGEASFIGFAGLSRPTFDAHFTPCVEIGWRLASRHWMRGYATEAAQAALRVAFDALALDEVVSFTVPANTRSIRVMEKLGLQHQPNDDFDHPRLPAGHALRRHVLYRLTRDEYALTVI